MLETMENKKPAPKTVEQKETRMKNVGLDEQQQQTKLELTKNIIILKPKVIPKRVFYYSGEKDLPNLCRVINRKPTLEFENGQISYGLGKKHPSLYKPCIIFLDSFGEVLNVEFDIKKILELFDFVSERDVNDTDLPKISTIPAKQKK